MQIIGGESIPGRGDYGKGKGPSVGLEWNVWEGVKGDADRVEGDPHPIPWGHC